MEPFSLRYDGTFTYPVNLSKEKANVSVDKAIIPAEYIDILKLAIAQYWNLISYDVFLNKEVDFAEHLLKEARFSFNFFKVMKFYNLLFREGKEFYRDKLFVVNSLYIFTKENLYSSSPEFLDFYKSCAEVLGLRELEKSVVGKIDQVSNTYSFLGESISTLLFIFFEIIFFLWLAWGIVDTFLLWRVSVK